MKIRFFRFFTLFLLLLWPVLLLAQDLQVHFINVGQGDSILIISPENKTVLIDAGKNSAGKVVTAYLNKYHVKNLDMVIETHPDDDHIGGMPQVVENYSISLYLDSGFEKSKSKALHELLSKKGVKQVRAKAGQKYPLDGANLEILFPSGSILPKPSQGTQSNVNSIVSKLTYKDVSFLLPGDAEKETEQRLLKEQKNKLASDVLKVAHHGSKYATTQDFIDAVNPKIAIISVGKNTYGHPDKGTIKRLKDKGVTVYRTDEQGNILIKTDGHVLDVITEKKKEQITSFKPRAPPLGIFLTPQVFAQGKIQDETQMQVSSKDSKSHDSIILKILLSGGILAAIISGIISCWIAIGSLHAQTEQVLTQQILQLNMLAMQYPYLEDDEFCVEWLTNKASKDEKYMRYDNYCCIVFNLIENIWKHFKGNRKRIESFFAIKELIVRHKLWWKNPSGPFENIEGYGPDFIAFINTYI